MRHAGETFSILVSEGEILEASYDNDYLSARADEINENNTNDEILEAGYDPEELTDENRAEFAFSAGFNGGFAYCEEVTIPEEPEENTSEDEDEPCDEVETEEDTIYTSEGDEFTYSDLISAIEEAENNNQEED